MSSWVGIGRTNYVRVKDLVAVETWIEQNDIGVEILKGSGANRGKIALTGEDYDADIPDTFDDDQGDEQDLLAHFVGQFLDPEDVLIYQSVGAENARYVSGYAAAYKKGAEPIYLSLDDIYDMAAEAFDVLTSEITQAVY